MNDQKTSTDEHKQQETIEDASEGEMVTDKVRTQARIACMSYFEVKCFILHAVNYCSVSP